MRNRPAVFVWKKLETTDRDGVISQTMAMVPLQRYANLCKRQFAEDGEYPLQIIEERSMASHSQFFAAINDSFANLPEKVAPRWPSPLHYRKWLLVEAGWFDEKEFECASEEQARGLARYFRDADDFARIFIRGKKVLLRTPKSQSLAAMGKVDFEASKRDCLDLAESLTGVPRGQAMREAGRSA